MSREGGKIQAVGIDASKGLPGLYWINFFGPPYRDLIGYDRFVTAPAAVVCVVDDGVLLRLHNDPTAWNTPEYLAIEHRIIAHLGSKYFFSKTDTAKQTVAPEFGELMPQNYSDRA